MRVKGFATLIVTTKCQIQLVSEVSGDMFCIIILYIGQNISKGNQYTSLRMFFTNNSYFSFFFNWKSYTFTFIDMTKKQENKY